MLKNNIRLPMICILNSTSISFQYPNLHLPTTMASTQWEKMLEEAQKTALMQDGRRKVHYTFKDGQELVEEYDSRSDELLIRKWRKKGALGEQKPWEIEIGEPQAAIIANKDIALMESSTNPVTVRRNKPDAFEWRIRNLPYPIDVYQITVQENSIVVRTTNKKFYKKLNIPDLERLGFTELDPSALTYAHANNTLIITYAKPQKVKEFEKRLLARLKKIKSDGEVDQCKQQ